MLVKDEADVIAQCLAESSRWIDRMYILDNGSTDGTWEILQSMQSERIVIWKRDFTPYRRTMRTEIFNEFRGEAQNGDWWYIADSDEFLAEDPRAFLGSVPRSHHVVFKKSIDYFLSPECVEEYDFSGDFSRDREHIQFISPNCWSEIRFFRHRDRLRWEPAEEKPTHIGIWHPEPILVRHYQYRSPAQMQRRLDIRNRIPRNSQGRPFPHVKEKDWRELLKTRDSLVRDGGIEQYRKLPMRRNLKEPFAKRILKGFFHGTGILP